MTIVLTLMKESPTATKTKVNEEDPGLVVILDARPPEEYDVSHVKDALRVDPNAELSDVKKTIALLQEHHGKQTVVSYCSLGYRSAKYAEALSKQLKKEHPDLENDIRVYNLEGGIFKWANEDKPMIDHKDRPTVYAHPYNAVFGKLLHQDLRKQSPEP
ncbi:hypothetical protein LSH36_1035g01084 [Paralvinella palmiformis]|uniref:Rhodanese domain-containing protein n=1 Tax=Paralvinella palmiformis TaxID=53620 RepID=A0AAD9IVQ1_9ANNE|nr:hypothetical protein LSH36_1035g01084 [Paralvinella palmiformis]